MANNKCDMMIVPAMIQMMCDKACPVARLAEASGVSGQLIYRMRRRQQVSAENVQAVLAALEAMPTPKNKSRQFDKPETTKVYDKSYMTQFGDNSFIVEHVVHIPGRPEVFRNPCYKSPEEIDRMHEYNRMFGRV